MNYSNTSLIIETAKTKEGTIIWRSPSNIALIKYWGKHGRQLPQNPSISLTLENAYTETELSFSPKLSADTGIELNFFFENEENEAFKNRVLKFLESILDIFPFLKQLNLTIKSSNSFPHSTGIASSASSMSALALCLCSLEHKLFGTLADDKAFRQKASYVARLGSGSASRSIFDTAAVWGNTIHFENSSDEYAMDAKTNIHPVFQTFHDDILIVSKAEKSVSSSVGHNLMNGNIFAENRYRQANLRFEELMDAMEKGDLNAFGKIVESEALTLHALMMTSTPPYILMTPDTLHIIKKIQAYRTQTQNPVFFTLDAGPNIHLLYPNKISNSIQRFINNELKMHCEEGLVISDKIGRGPLQL